MESTLNRARILPLYILLLLPITAARAQQAPINCKGPLSEEQLIGLLKGGVADVRVQAFIRKCHVSFSLTPEVYRGLRAAGASEAVVEMILSTGLSSAPGKTRPNDSGQITWIDSQTRLMWPLKDNGSDVDWWEATIYCRKLQLGGFSDWRLPKIDELEGIYNGSSEEIYKTMGGIKVTGVISWSATKIDSGSAWAFLFGFGSRYTGHLPLHDSTRALCVRRSGE
jgi:hypothetical protein